MLRPALPLARRLVAVAGPTPPGVDLLVGADYTGVVDIHVLSGGSGAALVGWRAPATWRAAVLLASGRRHASAPADRPIALIVDGHAEPALLIDDEILVCEPCLLTDVLQRVLGMATPAPTLEVSALAARLWLHRLLNLATTHPCPTTLSWPVLAARHPSTETSGAAAIAADAPDLIQTATRLDQPGGWAELAQLGPALSRWFDAGSFERFVLHHLPEPADVLDDLDVLLAPTCASMVRQVAAS